MQKHKLLSFLLALLAAIVLWVYAVTVVNPDDQISVQGVPVQFTGLNELQMNQLMLTGGEYQYVDVEIAGRRSDLKELNENTLKAVADLSNVGRPGVYDFSWTLDTPPSVATGDIKLVSYSTQKIKVKISEYKERTDIPVEVEYQGAVSEGFVRDNAVTNLKFVSASGPAEELEKISCARVAVDLADTKVSLDQELAYEFIGSDGEPLTLSEYVTVEYSTIRVMVPVYCFKQIRLDVELIPGGGAGIENAVCTIEPSGIGVIGDEDTLMELSSVLVIRTVKLMDIKDKLEFTIVPELPEGVSIRGEKTEITVKIELKDLVTRTIYVPCDRIVRDNDDVKLEFAVERIPIVVRGRATVVNKLSADTIRITADMANDFDPTNMTVKLGVSLKDGIEAGILGKYSVSVVETVATTEPDETTRDS